MFVVEEDCYLCGVTYSYRSLRRCCRCGRLYCRNCFLYDEEGKVICLNCARRNVSPHGSPKSKYAPLSIFLARRAKYANYVRLSFAEVEKIIGEHLPFSASAYKHWWNNVRNRSPSEAWLTVGWSVQDLDLEKKYVTFRKDEQTPVVAKIRRRRKPVSASFKALAVKRVVRRPSEPSKTRIAQVQARLRNIERRRPKAYRGRFKPKKAFEKRLYDLEEKPDKA